MHGPVCWFDLMVVKCFWKWQCGEGEGGMIWENSIETCILSYVKWIASPGSMHETGCSGLVHWDEPEGWDGERDGSRVQDGEHMYTCGVTIFYYIKRLEKKNKICFWWNSTKQLNSPLLTWLSDLCSKQIRMNGKDKCCGWRKGKYILGSKLYCKPECTFFTKLCQH